MHVDAAAIASGEGGRSELADGPADALETARRLGCDRRRGLHAHHRRHWAEGGETSLDNLVLLCWHHHRLVHEGGHTIEADDDGELRYRNRHGVLCPSVPRSPPGNADALADGNQRAGLRIAPRTNRNGHRERMDLSLAVAAVEQAVAAP